MYYKVCRSPSWGAWIEIKMLPIVVRECESRSPSWGAWIEILISFDDAVNDESLPLVGSVD